VPDYVGDIIACAKARDCVYPLNFVRELHAHSLGKTTGDNDPHDLATFFSLNRASYCLKRFIFGWFYESAGVNNHDISVINVICEDKTGLTDISQHLLAVHNVFGAAKRDKGYRWGVLFALGSHKQRKITRIGL